MQAHLSELQSTWTGQASLMFQSVMQQWNSAQRQVEQSLEHINGLLTIAGQQYANTEESNTRLFSS
ncbi:MAG: WXG100 family type VII secretion target [Micrococcaceae bacterium]